MTGATPLQEGAPKALPEHADVVVVGSGFAGVGAAVGLLRAGRRDLVVLERASSPGGVWRENSYPGCAVDVPSHLYSFSFAPHPGWTRTFSPQPEIEAYLQRVVRDFGVLPYLHLSTSLEEAVWDGAAAVWRLRTSRGPLTARVLVVGAGGLAEPAVPALPGLASFAGEMFHSATWRHDLDLTGRRVAVLGTGASAAQFVPEIAPVVGFLTLFQRTPPWVLPRRDRAISRLERALFARVPAAQRAFRWAQYVGRESWVLGFTHPRIMRRPELLARAFLARQVADPDLRAALTPSYRLGCKRVILSSTWYPALTRPNANVVTDPVVEVRPGAVVSRRADGELTEHAVDTLILGTGFQVADPPVASLLVGEDGRRLSQVWATTGMQALRGTTVAGFPNLFFLVGPNTGLGHTSIVVIVEAQVRYLLEALDVLDRSGLRAVAPRPAAQAAFNRRVQQQLAGTVWNTGGCSSWYLDPRTGGNTVLWPTFVTRYRWALRSFDLAEYTPVGAEGGRMAG